MPSWLLGCGVFVGLALIPIQVWAQPPVIRSIVPAQPTAGQVITIQGHSLFSTDTMVTVQIPGAQPPSGNAEVLSLPSNSNEVYVRLPLFLLLNDGYATLNLVANGITATRSFQVAAKPAAPIPRRICDTSSIRLGGPEIPSAVVGQRIGIQAFGTDISGDGVTAVFSQGTAETTVLEAVPPFTDATIGIVNEFMMPASLAPGLTLVQIRIGDSESDLSFALPLMIR
jgi:hypothetical protein